MSPLVLVQHIERVPLHGLHFLLPPSLLESLVSRLARPVEEAVTHRVKVKVIAIVQVLDRSTSNLDALLDSSGCFRAWATPIDSTRSWADIRSPNSRENVPGGTVLDKIGPAQRTLIVKVVIFF